MERYLPSAKGKSERVPFFALSFIFLILIFALLVGCGVVKAEKNSGQEKTGVYVPCLCPGGQNHSFTRSLSGNESSNSNGSDGGSSYNGSYNTSYNGSYENSEGNTSYLNGTQDSEEVENTTSEFSSEPGTADLRVKVITVTKVGVIGRVTNVTTDDVLNVKVTVERTNVSCPFSLEVYWIFNDNKTVLASEESYHEEKEKLEYSFPFVPPVIGTISIGARVSPLDGWSDEDTGNNVRSVELRISEGEGFRDVFSLPDVSLTTDDIRFLLRGREVDTMEEGNSVEVRVTIWNHGFQPAYNVSYTAKNEDNETLSKAGLRMPIAPGSSVSFSFDWSPEEGVKTVFITVDPKNLIEESDEGNNEAFRSIFVEKKNTAYQKTPFSDAFLVLGCIGVAFFFASASSILPPRRGRRKK